MRIIHVLKLIRLVGCSLSARRPYDIKGWSLAKQLREELLHAVKMCKQDMQLHRLFSRIQSLSTESPQLPPSGEIGRAHV